MRADESQTLQSQESLEFFACNVGECLCCQIQQCDNEDYGSADEDEAGRWTTVAVRDGHNNQFARISVFDGR